MFSWLKISHHHHTGRLRPHDHTSYPPLAMLIVFVGIMLAGTSYSIASGSPGPESGYVGLTGIMPKDPPKIAAVITSPINNQRISTSPITISGTCPPTTLVEIYKNEIFGGSVLCDGKGKFSLEVDLLLGENILIARVYDVLNQAGPDSAPVKVFYDALPFQADPLSIFNFSDSQLLIKTDSVYRGVFPNQQLNVPIDIIGGTPPYAVNIQWGDSSNKVIPRPDNTTFNATHVYKKPGTYKIRLQASDSQERVAFLTVVAIVNGRPELVAATSTTPKSPLNKVLMLWPVYTSVVTLVFSFWLGERREKKILTKRFETGQPL